MYKNVNQIENAAANVCFLYIQKPNILYVLNFCISNYPIFCSIFTTLFSSYSKRYKDEL